MVETYPVDECLQQDASVPSSPAVSLEGTTLNAEFRIDYRLRALVILATVLLLAYLNRKFHLDDALIYARYVRNALQGHGLVFNAGEPVNALTSMLETWLVVAVAWLLHGNVLLAQWLLGVVCLVAACWIAESIVPFAGILIAASSYYYFCLGMETSLYLLLLVLCLVAYLRGKLNWLPLLGSLVVLSRFEGGAMVLVLGWQLWKQRRSPSILSFLPALLLVACYLAFNLHNYHVLLPNSTTAKLGQGMSRNWGPWPLAFLSLPEFVYRPVFGSRIAGPIMFLLIWYAAKDKRLQTSNPIVLPLLVSLAAFYVLFNIPSYYWYYAPFLYFGYLYSAQLIPETRTARITAIVLAACLVAASAHQILKRDKDATDYILTSEWINRNTPPGAVIATTETGTMGWFCNRNLIDMVGLTTPKNATYTAHRDFSAWIAENPDYIVVHPEMPFPWEKVALKSPLYEELPYHFGNVMLLRRKVPTVQAM
jgi:hypothetical protein